MYPIGLSLMFAKSSFSARNDRTFYVHNNWNASQSYITGGRNLIPELFQTYVFRYPELGPSGVIGPSGVSTATRATGTATRSTSAGNSLYPTSGPSSNGGSSSSTAGAIAGGVVGGISAISVACVVVFYLRQRRLQTAPIPLTAQQQMDQVQQPPPLPPSDDRTFAPSSAPEIPMAPMRPHVRVSCRTCVFVCLGISLLLIQDLSDPTTFPRHQAGPPDGPPQMV